MPAADTPALVDGHWMDDAHAPVADTAQSTPGRNAAAWNPHHGQAYPGRFANGDAKPMWLTRPLAQATTHRNRSSCQAYLRVTGGSLWTQLIHLWRIPKAVRNGQPTVRSRHGNPMVTLGTSFTRGSCLCRIRRFVVIDHCHALCSVVAKVAFPCMQRLRPTVPTFHWENSDTTCVTATTTPLFQPVPGVPHCCAAMGAHRRPALDIRDACSP